MLAAKHLPVLIPTLGVLIIAGAAFAKEPAYVGIWATEPAQCKVGQEMEDAPLIIKAKRYDQHEAHCEFASIRQKQSTWSIKAQCVVEGDKQSVSFAFVVAGNRLSISTDGGPRQSYQRCR